MYGIRDLQYLDSYRGYHIHELRMNMPHRKITWRFRQYHVTSIIRFRFESPISIQG